MHNQAPDPNDLNHNPVDLSADEAAALATSSQQDPPNTQDPPAVAAEAPAQVTEPATTAPEAPVADPAPAQAASNDADIPAPPQPFYVRRDVETRDFKAETDAIAAKLISLKEQYRNDDINDDQYEQQYEALQDQKLQLRLAEERAMEGQRLNQASADQAWDYLVSNFLARPENHAIGTNNILFAAWEQAMQQVVDEASASTAALTEWQIMFAARKKLADLNMLPTQQAPAADGGQAIHPTPRPPQPDRIPPIGMVPQSLGTIPTGADPTSRGRADELSNMGIEELEGMMAGMTDAQRDEVLRSTPGGIAT